METDIYPIYINQRKARVAILISDNVDSREKNVTRDREGLYIPVESIYQEDSNFKCVHPTIEL